MSIAAALPAGPWPYLWTAYFVATVVVLLRTGWWRPVPAAPRGVTLPVPPLDTTPATPAVAGESVSTVLDYAPLPPDRLRAVPLLAVAGLLSFIAWVVVQLVYVAVCGSAEAFTAVDLTRLSLLSFGTGWAVGLGLLLAGRGVRTIGYSPRHFPAGMLSGVLGLLMAMPFVVGCLNATLWVLSDKHPPKHELLQALSATTSPWVKVGAILSAVVAAPLFEEMLFRGCVQGGLRRATRKPWVGILVASTLFASIHPPWTIPPIFVFSVLLGIVYERTRNLWATTCMHALFNAIAIVTNGS